MGDTGGPHFLAAHPPLFRSAAGFEYGIRASVLSSERCGYVHKVERALLVIVIPALPSLRMTSPCRVLALEMTGKSAATRSSKSSAVKKEIGKVKKEREPKQPVRVPTARRSKQKFTKALQKDVLALLQKREYQIPTEDDLAKSDKLRNLPYKQVVEFCRKQLSMAATQVSLCPLDHLIHRNSYDAVLRALVEEFHIPKDVKKKRAGKSQGPELEGLDSSSSSSSSSDDDDDDDETPHPQLESDVEIPSDVDDDDDDETNKEKKVKKEKKHKKTKKAPANVPPQAQNTSPAAPGSANPSTNSSAPPKIHVRFLLFRSNFAPYSYCRFSYCSIKCSTLLECRL